MARKATVRAGEDPAYRWFGIARVIGHDGAHGGSSHTVWLRYQGRIMNRLVDVTRRKTCKGEKAL